MSQPTVQTRDEALRGLVRRFVTYQREITWLGVTSSARGYLKASAALMEQAGLYYTGFLRRKTILAASGGALSEVLTERGSPRLGASRSKVLVIISPETANVANVRNVAGDDYIEIDDSTVFQAGDSFRIRNANGTTTEVATIASISTGTGPINGDDEIVVTGGLTNAYTPATEDVDVLFRATIPVETLVDTDAGVGFSTLTELTTGDSNAVLDGESTSLALADKVWCEAVTAGKAGQIGPREVTGFTVAIRGVKDAYNPSPATGGDDEESDYAAKERAMTRPTLDSQETRAALLALAQTINSDVLRIVKVDPTALNEIRLKVLHRSGGAFTVSQLGELAEGMEQHVVTNLSFEIENVTLTAVEAEYRVTLDSNTTLEAAWRAGTSRFADFIDIRKWIAGVDVDDSDLLDLIKNTPGIRSVETSSASPSTEIAVADDSFPVFVRLSLEDINSGETYNAELAVGF